MSFHGEPPAGDAGEVRHRHESNRAAWNEGAARYTDQVDETIAFLRAGGSSLHPIERGYLGNLRSWCQTAIHLQCASGRDTLSLWNERVERVVGIDISDVHIENARRTGEALGAPAAWYRCDLLDTPHELDGTADLVYTGRGAIGWIHDIDGWAAVVARLLRPGGILVLFDTHPVSWLFEMDAPEYSGIDYFAHAEASRGWPATYIGDLGRPAEELSELHERLWPLGEVFGALRSAGLAVEQLGEHREEYWDAMPNLRPALRGRIPMTFSLVARKPVTPLSSGPDTPGRCNASDDEPEAPSRGPPRFSR